MNVLDLRGPEFLAFYLTILPLAVAAACLLRWYLRRPGGMPALGALPPLHPFEVAYLAGGSKAATDAAIAALVDRGSLAVDTKTHRLASGGLPPAGVTPLEETIYNAVLQDGRVANVRRAVKDVALNVPARLQALGLVVSRADGVRIRLLPALLLGIVFALGAAKVGIGAQRHRPVGFLVPLTVVTAVLVVLFAVQSATRTRRGSRVLAALRLRNAALRTTARRAPHTLAGNDLSLAFALYGAAVFAWGPMDDLRRTLAPPSAGGSGCGSSAGCGSSSGGDSGGSSCGGGGGGCGGCGGGGGD